MGPAQADRRITVPVIGTTQTLAWASSYYLPAVLAGAMARDLGVAASWVFGAFTAALIVMGLVAPTAGRAIDRLGGRQILCGSNLLFALGLCIVSAAHGMISLFLGWLVIGVAMAGGLYDAAFATLARYYGKDARSAITGVTLMAGFASTIGWPLSTLLLSEVGWRDTCLLWAGVHLLIALPLNFFLLPQAERQAPVTGANGAVAAQPPDGRMTMVVLAAFFAIVAFVSTGMAAHLPRLLHAAGTSEAIAVTAAALVGPAQVGARIIEFALLRRLDPIVTACIAIVLHPMGAALLLAFGAPATFAFALLHGGGNGMLTIAKGTLPLALFGSTGYGRRVGLISRPAAVAQALAPLGFGLVIEHIGVGVLFVSAALGLLGLALMFFLAGRRKRLARKIVPQPA